MKAFGKLFSFIGLCIFVIGAGKCAYNFWFISKANQATGKVVGHWVDYENTTVSNGRSMRFPVVGYQSADQTDYRVKAGTGFSLTRFRKGDAVVVYYDPGNPEKMQINDIYFLWGLESLFIVMGLLMMFFGRKMSSAN